MTKDKEDKEAPNGLVQSTWAKQNYLQIDFKLIHVFNFIWAKGGAFKGVLGQKQSN